MYDPDKFQTIAVGKKTYVKEPVFNIESANIACDDIVKLLGMIWHVLNGGVEWSLGVSKLEWSLRDSKLESSLD